MSRYRIVTRESEDEITYLSLRMVSRGIVRYGEGTDVVPQIMEKAMATMNCAVRALRESL